MNNTRAQHVQIHTILISSMKELVFNGLQDTIPDTACHFVLVNAHKRATRESLDQCLCASFREARPHVRLYILRMCNVVLTLNKSFAYSAFLEHFTHYSWQSLCPNFQWRASRESYGARHLYVVCFLSDCPEHPRRI